MTKKRKGARKKDSDLQKTLSRAFIVIILFACVIGFTLSFSFFSIFKTVEAGDYVIVDYTLSYQEGAPIISSDPYLIQDAYEYGIPVAYSNSLILQAGSLQSDKIIPVDVYIYPEGDLQYALFDLELDAISSEVEGMHENDVKKFEMEFAPSLIENMSAEEYELAGANFSQAQIGMVLPLAFGYSGDGEYSENTTVTLSRPAVIVGKTDDMVILNYGYNVAEIQVKEIR